MVNLAARLANHAKGGQIIASSNFKAKGDSKNYTYIDLGARDLKGLGKQRIYELLWRSEVARLTTKNNELILILTKDHLAIELSKDLQNEIIQAQEELRREAKNESGLAKFVLEKVESYVDRYLSRAVGWLLTKKGIGLEHPVGNVKLKYGGGKLTVFIKGEKALILTKKEIEPSIAEEFVTKFRSLQSSRKKEKRRVKNPAPRDGA